MSAYGPSFPVEGGGGGGANPQPVTPPAPTSQSVSAGGSLSAKTFGSFTDPDSRIDNFVSSVTNASGSASVSGSGLGPYTFSSTANGDSGTLSLTARDASNNPLATATHSFRIAASAGGITLADLVDFSGTSYNFLTTGGSGGSGGAGAHTVGGLSVTLDYRGTSGPSALAMSSGTISCTLASGKKAYLIIDIGADVDDSPWVVNGVATNVASGGSNASIFWQVADDTTIPHNSKHFQWLLGTTGVTTLLERECTSSSPAFTNVNTRTITNYTTTPTRMQGIILGDYVQLSFDQGTASLPPVDGKQLSTAGPKDWQSGQAAAVPGNRRYIHLQFGNYVGSAEFKIQAYRLRTS